MRCKREDGFTIPEALIAMGIVSLCLAMISGLCYSSVNVLKICRETAEKTAGILKTDTLFRSAAGTVAIPFWEKYPPITETPVQITIPWYEGDRDSSLSFRVDGKKLIMETETRAGVKSHTLLDRADGIAIALITEENRIPRGIELSFRLLNRAYDLKAYFGSTVL
jgi:type II secretory pathway pseudopilin PulG